MKEDSAETAEKSKERQRQQCRDVQEHRDRRKRHSVTCWDERPVTKCV